MKKKVVIIGAGPAGLTAAYELLSKSKEYEVTILEESNDIGGISKTVKYNGYRMDIGGHRFFSKDDRVINFWTKFLPIQGSVAKDYKLTARKAKTVKKGPNPDNTDNVMLVRNRISRIYYANKFFDYPISLKWQTIKNMGIIKTIQAGFSYLKTVFIKKKETNLENFYINRFGKKLYKLFFEKYTEKLWGRHPREISADWGSQRVKGLSIFGIIKDIFGKIFHIKNRHVETSLIEEFYYPKLGPGQLWEKVASEIVKMGGKILKNESVSEIRFSNGKIVYVKADSVKYTGDIFISSMPIKDLINGLVGDKKVSKNNLRIANGLSYRDFITVGFLVKNLKLVNKTGIKTLGNIIPDNWIYVQDEGVNLLRIQIFNNWSPYLVKKNRYEVWLGAEYTCQEGDSFWNSSDKEIAEYVANELEKIGIIDKRLIKDYHVEKIKKAYPSYFDTYYEIDKLVNYLDNFGNLYCIGRNGQHRYNNMDHSMITAFEAVDNIINGIKTKENIWNVNTEKVYHEEKRR